MSAGRDSAWTVREIRHSIALKAPIERVWRALATSEGLATWLMPNDFQPVVGARFTFKEKPRANWNGIVECEVLVLEEPYKLAFSWSGAPGLPSTVVTFELHDLGDQTEIRFQHSGWEKLPPEQARLRDKLDQGWGSKITQRLAAAVG